jgi:hypothetical protein
LLKFADPIVYYDYLNSLAVELGAAGRKYEARNIIRHVLASPFARAYPEWRGTADDLSGPSRSFIVIDPGRNRPRNVLVMPVVKRESSELPAWAGQLANVVNYQEWKRRMAKKKGNGKPVEEMTEQEMFMEIMRLFVDKETTDEQRRKMYDAAVKIISEPEKPDTPDDDKSGA